MNYSLVNKFLYFFIISFILCGCNYKEQIEFKRFDSQLLHKDLKILKGIITEMHAGVYAYNTPAQINSIFDSISNSIKQPTSIREFYSKLDYLLDKIRCIHTSAYLPDEYFDSISIRPVFFPTPLININNKPYVNTDLQSIPLGAEVVSINGISSQKMISAFQDFKHADGYSSEIKKNAINDDFALDYFLVYGGAPNFIIEFIKDSSTTVETEIFRGEKLLDLYKNENSTKFYYYPTDVNYDFEINDRYNTAVLTVRSFSYVSSNSLHAFKNFIDNSFRLIRQNGIKNLIIDCRNNGGGYYNSTYSLLNFLVCNKLPEYDSVYQRFKHLTYTEYIAKEDTNRIQEIDTAFLNSTKTKEGIYKFKEDEINVWEPQQNIFNGKIFVIVNGNVVSAAATFAAVLKDKTNAIIIGEETGGANDAHNAYLISFVLPNFKIKVDIPLRRYFQPIIKKEEGRGVVPSKYIPFTVYDLVNNTDRPLSYIYDSLLNPKTLK